MSYDVAALRADQFPVTRRLAYLDNATFGPLPRACVEAASACLRELSEGTSLPVPWASETERVRVWSITLAPGERLGAHRHPRPCQLDVVSGSVKRTDAPA